MLRLLQSAALALLCALLAGCPAPQDSSLPLPSDSGVGPATSPPDSSDTGQNPAPENPPSQDGQSPEPPPPTAPPAWGPGFELTAVDAAATDRFGIAVAISGDTVVVGAPGKDDYTGAAYVFVRDAAGWTLQWELRASDERSAVAFGSAVAIDGNTSLVGAPLQSPPDTAVVQCGASYVFQRTGNAWAQKQRLALSDAQSFDYLGQSLTLQGGTALIGAFGRNSLQGTAYVFTNSGSGFTQQARLRPELPGASWFGWAVGLSGNTAAIGAHVQDGGTGAAYIFTGSEGKWSLEQKLLAPNAAEGDNFGQAIAIGGDTVAVSSPGKSDLKGEVNIFVRSGGTWSLQQTLASPEAAGSGFGASLALNGDTLLVGAPEASAVLVYVRAGGTWAQQARLTSQGSGDRFGVSVAIDGNTAVSGAEENSDKGNAAGAGFIFQRQ